MSHGTNPKGDRGPDGSSTGSLMLSASIVPTVIGELVIEATSDVLLTLKYMGSDSVIRIVELPLT